MSLALILPFIHADAFTEGLLCVCHCVRSEDHRQLLRKQSHGVEGSQGSAEGWTLGKGPRTRNTRGRLWNVLERMIVRAMPMEMAGKEDPRAIWEIKATA